MKQLNTFLFLCFFMLSCTKTVSTKDFILDVIVNPEEVQADGSTEITIKALLNNDLDKRAITFETNKGSFVNSTTGNKITITAEKVNDTLVAVATLKAPATPGPIEISIQPDITDLEGKYVFKKTINATISEPSKIDLFANAFSVHNDFNGEIELTATLTNANNKGVSQGTKVLIEEFDANFNRIQGVFRNASLSTKADSKVSALYTPGPVAAGQDINLVATVLDAAGNKTSIIDTLKIFVTKKD